MAEDWNAPKWANGAKEDKQRERTSLRMEGRVEGCRWGKKVGFAVSIDQGGMATGQGADR